MKVLNSLLFLTILMILSGCVAIKPYRTDFASLCTYKGEGSCENNAKQQYFYKNQSYKLYFVEFDDQGQLLSPAQNSSVIQSINESAKQEELLLVVFVHGWHHSAKLGDSNITAFRGLLKRASTEEALYANANGLNPRKVVGVYLGWRGASMTMPLVRHLTFWGRKATAQSVGTQAVTDTLLQLENIVTNAVDSGKDTHMVTVGHSFGALVTYSALQSILSERFIQDRPYGKSTQAGGFGSLVVLVNPAFEALRYTRLYDLSQHGCLPYPESQTPKLLLITSKKDRATKLAFPVGRYISTLSQSHVDIERNQCPSTGLIKQTIRESKADKVAVGHFKPYITHKLVIDEASQSSNIKNLSRYEKWKAGLKAGKYQTEGSLALVSLDKTHAFNPYLNIQVSEDIIPDHNNIWGYDITKFLAEVMRITSHKQPITQSEKLKK